MADIKRSTVNKINHLMEHYPAVVLIGARQVGKTTILKQVLPAAKIFDLEGDPRIIFKDYKKPIVFDEAQRSKTLFKALRVEIDKTRENGQFLLSASSSPELLSNISETLAGIIAIVEIPCLNFSESHSAELSKLMEVISSDEAIKKLSSICITERFLKAACMADTHCPFRTKGFAIF